MLKFLKHFLFPAFSNNQKARLIHNQIIFVVALLLIGSSFLLNYTRRQFPQVLGIAVNIATSDLLSLTNAKRAEAGLGPLQLDNQLSEAAQAKAQDMFAKGYWAHFAPDGKSPWDFIRAAGYSYIYAGENLARGFTTSTDVINAWMASPDHRANMLNGHYTDVGFAIAQGPLPGDSNTVLVVEMFGNRFLAAAPQKAPPVIAQAVSVTPSISPTITLSPISPTPVLAAVRENPLLSSKALTKVTSLTLLSLFLLIFGLDVVFTESRKTVRLAGHSFDHLLFLIGILIIAISLGLGVIA